MRWVLFFLILLPGLCTIYLLEPLNLSLSNGDTVVLGKIAPKENFTVLFSKQSDIIQTCAGLVVCGPNESKNPIVWNWNAFKIEEQPDVIVYKNFPRLDVYVPENASVGEKRLSISFHVCSNPEFIDYGCHDITLPEKITLLFTVDRNPYEIHVNKRVYPASEMSYILLNITSYSLGKNSFYVASVSGLPREWIGPANSLSLGPKESGYVYIPITPKEEGLYSVNIRVVRSDGYRYDINEKIRTVPTFTSKLSVFNEGIAIVPPILQPFYSFFGIFG